MNSLRTKLIAAFLVVGVAGIGLVAVFTGFAAAGEFGEFVRLQRQQTIAQELLDFYSQRQGWEGLSEGFAMQGPGGARPWGTWLVVDDSGTVIHPGLGFRYGETIPPDMLEAAMPLIVNGRLVGQLIPERVRVALSANESSFISRINTLLLLGGLGGLTAALILAAFLARSLTRPLRELTLATKQVAAGNLEARVPVRSEDELGELAVAFNQMNEQLARSRDVRRQMTADIAHELRTPISIILGHAEAIEEGVLGADPETVHVIRDEAQRLERLVEELRLLSLADAGELRLIRRQIQPRELLEQALVAHRPMARRQGKELELHVSPELPMIEVDLDRMLQVLSNLIDNALQHTPRGGEIQLSGEARRGVVRLQVRDSGPGISTEDLPHIFDRFYRSDKSRHRSQAGSGLGLAIAKSLVEAHGGRIGVESQPGAGSSFYLEIPAQPAA